MKSKPALAALAIAATLIGSGAAFAQDSEDTQIQAAVRKQLNELPSLRFYNITVQSDDHVVYLEGLVSTRVERSEAVAVARGVPGVQKVYNELALDN
jgi:osmotically-inducible protein OsmY